MSNIYINPKIDYAFKIIFGQEHSKSILLSFLNAMLYKGEAVITAVEILNPYLPSDVSSHKDTYVDIQAILNNGSIVLIEMQMVHTQAFFKRVLYNTAKRYSSHLTEGDSYTKLTPIISLTIANFTYHKNESQLLTTFKMYEHTESFPYPAADDFQIVIAELPKFKKTETDIDSLTDKWLFFLQYAQNLTEVPKMMSQTEEINKAFEIAKRINLKQLELVAIERRELDAIATKQERELAIQEGLKQGLEQGLKQGLEQGKKQIIQHMLGLQMTVDAICSITAVPRATVLDIQQEQINLSS